VAEAAEIRSEGSVGSRWLEAKAEACLALENRAPTFRLGRGRLGEQIATNDGDPVDITAGCQGGVEACDAASRGVQVG
jgi:hypothetical protein